MFCCPCCYGRSLPPPKKKQSICETTSCMEILLARRRISLSPHPPLSIVRGNHPEFSLVSFFSENPFLHSSRGTRWFFSKNQKKRREEEKKRRRGSRFFIFFFFFSPSSFLRKKRETGREKERERYISCIFSSFLFFPLSSTPFLLNVRE